MYPVSTYLHAWAMEYAGEYRVPLYVLTEQARAQQWLWDQRFERWREYRCLRLGSAAANS